MQIYHIFEAWKYAFLERFARFARSRVLVKWVKAFYSIEYNQSNINNGSDMQA